MTKRTSTAKPRPHSKANKSATPPARRRVRRAGQLPVQAQEPARRRKSSVITHVTAADGNVFADLGFSPERAANLALRSDLMSVLQRAIAGMTQVRAAKRLGVSQPRISELNRGYIDRFTIDALVNMLTHAGGKAQMLIKPPRRVAA